MKTKKESVTREMMEDAGWFKMNNCWVSPYDGFLMSFDDARYEEGLKIAARESGEDDEF